MSDDPVDEVTVSEKLSLVAAVSVRSCLGLTILYHPDFRRVGEIARLEGLGTGGEAMVSRKAPLFAPPATPDSMAPLADLQLSREPLRIVPTEAGGACLAGDPRAKALVGGEPPDPQRVFVTTELERGVSILLGRRILIMLHQVPAPSAWQPPGFGLIGDASSMVRVRQQIQLVADLDVSVCLRGETGTGKELVARALHSAGKRARQPFLAINMAAIPAELAASELFGAAPGAFTGAKTRRLGYFERADGGVLFLDEIGALPLDVQATLLRALESGEIQPVGAESPRPVDVRVVAATDADLESAAAAGEFRGPLLHRLSGYQIWIPPLRERREDVGRLFFHFLRRELEALGGEYVRRFDEATPAGEPAWVPPELVAELVDYPWPGNVRQLQNVVRQLVIDHRDSPQMRLDGAVGRLLEQRQGLGRPRVEVTEGVPAPATAVQARKTGYRHPSEISEAELIEALQAQRWQIKPTAIQLGVSRSSLYALIERSDRVHKAADLPAETLRRSFEDHRGDLEAMVDELQVSKDALVRRLRDLGMTGGAKS